MELGTKHASKKKGEKNGTFQLIDHWHCNVQEIILEKYETQPITLSCIGRQNNFDCAIVFVFVQQQE
jgi:hypothetical protein